AGVAAQRWRTPLHIRGHKHFHAASYGRIEQCAECLAVDRRASSLGTIGGIDRDRRVLEADQVRQVMDHDPGVSLRIQLLDLCDRAPDRPVELVEIDIWWCRAVKL